MPGPLDQSPRPGMWAGAFLCRASGVLRAGFDAKSLVWKQDHFAASNAPLNGAEQFRDAHWLQQIVITGPKVQAMSSHHERLNPRSDCLIDQGKPASLWQDDIADDEIERLRSEKRHRPASGG